MAFFRISVEAQLGWTLTQYDFILIKRRILAVETDTHTGAILCEDEGRFWSGAFTSNTMPEMASKPPEAR